MEDAAIDAAVECRDAFGILRHRRAEHLAGIGLLSKLTFQVDILELAIAIDVIKMDRCADRRLVRFPVQLHGEVVASHGIFLLSPVIGIF